MRESVDLDAEKLSELSELEEEESIKNHSDKERPTFIDRGMLTIKEIADGERSGASSPSPSDGTC